MSKRSKKFLKVVNKRALTTFSYCVGKLILLTIRKYFPKAFAGKVNRTGGGAPRKRNIIQFQPAKIKV